MVGWAYDGPFDELPAQHHAARLSRRNSRAVVEAQNWAPARSARSRSTASSPGTRSAKPRAPASSTSPPAAAKRTSSSAKRTGLPPVAPLDEAGVYLDRLRRIDAASRPSIRRRPTGSWTTCKQKDVLFATEKYPHSYPHCWRCKTELLFRLVDEWFIDMSWRDEIMPSASKQADGFRRSRSTASTRARLAQEHGRLDDLQEALLGPGAADLGGRGHRRLRGDRLARGIEKPSRRGLGRSSRAIRRIGRGSTWSRSAIRRPAT